MKRNGFTLFELLLVNTAFGAAIFCALYGLKKYGVIGGILGLPIGFIGFWLGFFLFILILCTIEGILTGTLRWLPRCRTGKCKSGFNANEGDYCTEIGEDNFASYRCRCGDLYKRDRKKKTVYFVHPDGTQKVYKVARPFRGWVNPPTQE